MNKYSTFLFAEPSFLEGVGRLMDFQGLMNQYNSSPTAEQADETALYADWRAVGESIAAAAGVYSSKKQIGSRRGQKK